MSARSNSIDLNKRTIILSALIVLTAAVIIGNAWICDDIYITLRTVDNFVNGYGLRWNIGERVQGFTHPLWLALITPFYYVTREGYFTILFISLGLTLATVGMVLFRMSRTIIAAVLGTAILLLSKAFVDYSSSGLETPLSYSLVALFYYVYLRWPDDRRKLFFLSLLTSLGALNRPDLVLFFLPAWGYQIVRHYSMRNIATVVLGFVPLIGWEIFSVAYYGMPFPNTYYAKLHTGIGGLDLARQGVSYFVDSITTDPLTLITIILTCLIIAVGGNLRQRMLPAGIALNLIYVMRIGGCFMSGRYFAVPLLASVVLILMLAENKAKPSWRPVLIGLLAVA
ncbi:MAG: hypothetical protein KAT79_07380, partial [candidate division Zixibacteria bacterium]|nr:hypothetical protein [candidate division Zixibacteria bacterium]